MLTILKYRPILLPVVSEASASEGTAIDQLFRFGGSLSKIRAHCEQL
jgi:hypothetical protein